MADVATRVVLPMFKARNKPFVLVFWSRDPDASQHNTGDSLNTLTPGINGPTAMAGIGNADNNLARLRKALDDLGLSATTNIMISSDHGFSTISKESKTSPSAKVSYEDTPKDFLPLGFVALDLARRSICRCSIPTTRMRASPRIPIPAPETVCSDTIPPSRTWSWLQTAGRTSSIFRARTENWLNASSKHSWSKTTSAVFLWKTISAAIREPSRYLCSTFEARP